MIRRPYADYSLDALLLLAEERATDGADGHLTILAFTTGWKIMYGTPDLDTGAGRAAINALRAFPSARAALTALLTGGMAAVTIASDRGAARRQGVGP